MDLRKHSQTSNLIRVVFKNSSTGVGLTGLTEASAGLIIATIADVESATTRYRASSSEIETISVLGTYAAPTSGKVRFKEVDATNHPGLYEIQLADARFAVSNAKRLVISWSGATNLLAGDYEIKLIQVDLNDAVRMGLTALPNAAAESAGGLYTRGTGAGQINQPANGMVDTNVVRNAGTAITAASGIQEVKVASIANDAISAAAIADNAIDRATFAADTGLQSIRSNTAQAGATSTITLDAGASAVDDFYNSNAILTTGGTGAGQFRTISDYVGSTKVATVDTPWATNPDNTTTFAIFPEGSSSADIAAAVWAAAVRTLTAATNITSTGGTTVPQTGDTYARLGAPAGASTAADIAAVKVDTAAIKVKSDKLTFTSGNDLDANIQKINDTAVNGNGAGTPWGP